jgi:hypothetical protein
MIYGYVLCNISNSWYIYINQTYAYTLFYIDKPLSDVYDVYV